MQVEGVLETSLYAEDLAAAEKFYGRVLGLEVKTRSAGRHVFFHCGEGMLLLFNPAATEISSGEVPAHGARGPGHVAFAVPEESLPAWREHLSRSGVQIETEIGWPSGGWSIYFRDPAGNSLELATRQTWA